MANEEFENWLDAATRSLSGRSRWIARVYLRGNPEEVARMNAMLDKERQESEREDIRRKNDDVDRINTRYMSASAREAYYMENIASLEEREAYHRRCADERKKRQFEERLAMCYEIDYLTTRHMTEGSRRAYYVYNHGTEKEIEEFEALVARERAEEARDARIRTEDHQRKEGDRLEALKEIKQPLNDFLEGNLPSESGVLVGVLKNIMEMEKRWSFKDDDRTVVIRDFLDQALEQTLETINQTNGIYTPQEDERIGASVSKYLKIVRAAQDAGYTHLNMRHEMTYYLNSDPDKDLGFGRIKDCIFQRRKQGHDIVIELPRDYSEEYPQNYAGALEIINAMQNSIEGNFGQAKTDWRLLGYKSPDELRDSLADMSIEERTAEAKSGRRGAIEWKRVQEAAQRHETRLRRLPYGMEEKIADLDKNKGITPAKIEEATIKGGVTASGMNRAEGLIEETINPASKTPGDGTRDDDEGQQ